jgi:amidase
MTAPHELSASELAAAIRERRFSATEAVEDHLQRIDRLDGALNAIVTLDAEGALARARQADDALARGEPTGALHGVPVTIKDCHATAGMRTTVGHEPLRDHVPTEHGTVAARLVGAGAIVLGKTNVPPLLLGPYTDNAIFGRTNNPWDRERTPGGSSGGSAAAVAARLSALDIGSDAIGSVRLPAHFCGLFGLKPSERRVSMHGHYALGELPGSPHSWRAMATIGPLARSLDDIELAFALIAGPDGHDTDVPPLAVTRVPTPELSSLRIAVARTLPSVPVSREVGDAIEDLGVALARAGARVEPRSPELDVPAACATMWSLVQALGSASEPLPREPSTPRIVSWTRLFTERDAMIRTADAFMQEYDALLMPATISTAFRHGAPREAFDVDGNAVEYLHYAHHCALWNATGQPAIVLPFRRSEGGLPIGVQLVGRRWYDERLLAVARAVAALTGPFAAPPGY